MRGEVKFGGTSGCPFVTYLSIDVLVVVRAVDQGGLVAVRRLLGWGGRGSQLEGSVGGLSLLLADDRLILRGGRGLLLLLLLIPLILLLLLLVLYVPV